MKILPTAIPDVLILEPEAFGDDRGWFMERYNEQRFQGELIRLGFFPWTHRARPADQRAPGGRSAGPCGSEKGAGETGARTLIT